MYLAYYKDIVFGLCCVVEFIGIYLNTFKVDTAGLNQSVID